jgi:hypothetical protein
MSKSPLTYVRGYNAYNAWLQGSSRWRLKVAPRVSKGTKG